LVAVYSYIFAFSLLQESHNVEFHVLGCYVLVVLIGVLVVVYCLLDIDVFGYAVFQCQHYYGDMVHLCVLANVVLVGVSLKLVVIY
jgi:hypothetical protein